MKIKIKSYFGDLPEYLKLNELYEVSRVDSQGVATAKTGSGIYFDACLLAPSERLNGGMWEIVDE